MVVAVVVAAAAEMVAATAVETAAVVMAEAAQKKIEITSNFLEAGILSVETRVLETPTPAVATTVLAALDVPSRLDGVKRSVGTQPIISRNR